MAKTISIIVPTYKEKDNIVPLVERIQNSLAKYDYDTPRSLQCRVHW